MVADIYKLSKQRPTNKCNPLLIGLKLNTITVYYKQCLESLKSGLIRDKLRYTSINKSMLNQSARYVCVLWSKGSNSKINVVISTDSKKPNKLLNLAEAAEETPPSPGETRLVRASYY